VSVINQMLNDIEHRENQQHEQAAHKLDYLQVKEPKTSRGWLLGLALLLALIGGGWWLLPQSSQPSPVAITQQALPSVPAVIIAQPEVVKSDTAQLPAAVIVKAKAPTIVPVPIIETKSVVASIVETTVALAPKRAPSSLSIKPVKLTALEVAQLKYQQGLKQQDLGKITAAQQSWIQALQVKPNLHNARESLAASYYGANQITDALATLEQGILSFPTHQSFSVMTAQILYKQQRPKLALVKLNSPYSRHDSSDESLALAGSIAQSLALWPQAQQNYQVLHQRQPHHPKWLIGLAISLDGQGKAVSARDKYQQFLRLPDLDQALSSYADERIIQLERHIETRENNGKS